MYIIKEFGTLSRAEQISILKKFQGDKEMLFPYYVPGMDDLNEKELESLIEDVLEIISVDYFEGILYLVEEVKRNIDRKIEQRVY